MAASPPLFFSAISAPPPSALRLIVEPMIAQHRILVLLDYVKDPEIPAINVLELGVVRSVEASQHRSFDV